MSICHIFELCLAFMLNLNILKKGLKMKVFENTTIEQEILLTLSMFLIVIVAYIVSFTNIETDIISTLFGNNPNIVFIVIASFIFRSILALIIAIPMLSSLCYCTRDNFIKSRFC